MAFDPEPTATMLNPVAPGSIGRLEKADADNGQEPKYIESVSIANGQQSRLNMPRGGGPGVLVMKSGGGVLG